MGKPNEGKRPRDQEEEEGKEHAVENENQEDVYNGEKRQKVPNVVEKKTKRKKKKKTPKKKQPEEDLSTPKQKKHRMTVDEEVVKEAQEQVHVTGEEAEQTPP